MVASLSLQNCLFENKITWAHPLPHTKKTSLGSGFPLQVLSRSFSNNLRNFITSSHHHFITSIKSGFRAFHFNPLRASPATVNCQLKNQPVNPSAHHSQILGQVLDATTEQPLQMVKVKATSGDRVYEDMTDSEGTYKLPVNPEIWDVRFATREKNPKQFV